MCKQILLPTSVKQELRQTFKTNHMTLDRALQFKSNSSASRKLRAAALQRGGLIYTGTHAPNGYCPDVETTHDHVNGIMRQSIGGRVKLEVKRGTNETAIFIDEEPVATFRDITLSDWGNVLYSLQQVYNQLNS